MLITLIAPLSLLALAAQETPPSPPVGRRTTDLRQMQSGIGMTPDTPAEEGDEIAAASAHPLGSRENPIRVGGPEGERAYLARLRCANGDAPRIDASREDGVGAFGTLVNSVTLDCGTSAPGRATLLIDLYHEEHQETQAPTGFTLQAR